MTKYRGRIAPTPTGFLHAGHAATFAVVSQRARERGGTVVLRMEDLDPLRCREEFARAAVEDLRALGLEWKEGPDVGGPFPPYKQSECMDHYRGIFHRLRDTGSVYPCTCSRKDIREMAQAPQGADDELIYAGTCRGLSPGSAPPECAWRFRVPDGEPVEFLDGGLGRQRFVAGQDFGDFPVWRRDGVPSYQLAVVADDHRMQITEVVRGADLLVSTARQILLYRALGWEAPFFYHCPLVLDENGRRLAKRDRAMRVRPAAL